MNTFGLKSVLLVFAIQWIAITAACCLDHTALEWLAMLGSVAAFVIPFPGYIVALSRAPRRFAASKVGRIAVLSLLSFFLTIFGGAFMTLGCDRISSHP